MLTSLSILIPCFNVEATVENVIRDAHKIGNQVTRRLTLYAIDDGSRDKTGTILASLAKKLPALTVITHERNQGYGKTIKELYQIGRGQWLFTLPGDNQFSAFEIAKLLPKTLHADMVLGWRKTRHDSARRRLQSAFYNGCLRFLYGLTLHDVNTIRLMKKDIITKTNLTTASAFVDAELAIDALGMGYTIEEVPIVHRKRISKGATGGSFFKTILPTMIDMLVYRTRI